MIILLLQFQHYSDIYSPLINHHQIFHDCGKSCSFALQIILAPFSLGPSRMHTVLTTGMTVPHYEYTITSCPNPQLPGASWNPMPHGECLARCNVITKHWRNEICNSFTFTFPTVASWLQHFSGDETTIMKSAQVNALLRDANGS